MKSFCSQDGAGEMRPAAAPKLVRIALVEDQADMRESWRRLINGLSGFTCFCACASAEEALEVLPAQRPDLVVMDLKLPGMDGIQCTAKLKALLPLTQVLILTVGADSQTLFEALAAGARGCLLKRSRPEQLQAAIHEVLAGGAPFSSEVARHVMSAFRRSPAPAQNARLTPREEEVLALLARGFGPLELTEKLAAHGETLRGHLKEIYDKLHLQGRLESGLG